MKKTFTDYAIPSQKLKHVLHQDPGWIALEPAQGELLDKTCEFIAGVLSARPGAWVELNGINALADSLGLPPKVSAAPPKVVPLDSLGGLSEKAATDLRRQQAFRIAGLTPMEAELETALRTNLGGASPTSA